jgi:hypothetical protein
MKTISDINYNNNSTVQFDGKTYSLALHYDSTQMTNALYFVVPQQTHKPLIPKYGKENPRQPFTRSKCLALSQTYIGCKQLSGIS